MERWRVVDGWMPCIERLGRWYAVAESEIWDAAWRGQSVVGRHHQNITRRHVKSKFQFHSSVPNEHPSSSPSTYTSSVI